MADEEMTFDEACEWLESAGVAVQDELMLEMIKDLREEVMALRMELALLKTAQMGQIGSPYVGGGQISSFPPYQQIWNSADVEVSYANKTYNTSALQV